MTADHGPPTAVVYLLLRSAVGWWHYFNSSCDLLASHLVGRLTTGQAVVGRLASIGCRLQEQSTT